MNLMLSQLCMEVIEGKNIWLVHAPLSVGMMFLLLKAGALSRWSEARNLSTTPDWYTRFIMMCFEVCHIGVCNSFCLPSSSHQMVLVLYQVLILPYYCSHEVDKHYP